MPPSQFEEVLTHIEELNLKKWDPNSVRMVFKIARWCGLRLYAEACKIKIEDIDLQLKELYLGKTKTRTEDYAAIPDPFIPELSNFIYNRRGLILDPIPTRDTVQKWIQRLGEKCDVKAWTTPQSETHEKTKMHILRKSIGKDMIYGVHEGKKAPLNIVMKHLRHADLGTTSKYLKVDIEEAKDYWES